MSQRAGAGLWLLVAGSLALAGCAWASGGSGAPSVRVYVANGADETIAALDGERGTLAGPARPVGMALRQVVAGPNGSLLVLSAQDGPVGIRHVEPAGDGWLATPVTLEVGTTDAVLASNGAGQAAVAYHVPRGLLGGSPLPRFAPAPAPPAAAAPVPAPLAPAPRALAPIAPGAAGQPQACRLALLDGRSGGVQSTLPACGAGETVTGLALGADPAQPMVYLAIRDDSPRRLFTTVEGRHRIVAMNAATGTVVSTSPLDGVPSLLAAAPVSWGRPRWLYAIQEPPRSVPAIGRLPLGSLGPAGVITGSAAPSRATGRQLIRLRPDSLEVDRAIPIGGPVSALAAGDDREVYLLQADTLTRVIMSTGVVQTVAHLPAPGHDLAVTPRWVFVTHPEGDEVWAIERRTGRLVRRIATGREPLGISVVLT